MKRAKRTISKTLCVFTLLRHIIRCIIHNNDGLTCRLIICVLDGRGIVDDQYWKTFECVHILYSFYSCSNHAWFGAKSLNVLCRSNCSPYVIPLLAEPMNLTRWEELPVPVKNQVCPSNDIDSTLISRSVSPSRTLLRKPVPAIAKV